MKTTLFIALSLWALSISYEAHSQQSIKKIESGKDLEDFTTLGQQYLFAEFEEGTVLKKDGSYARGKMNYNLVVGEMQFIDPQKEEVLALAEITNVAAVSILGRFFVPFSSKGEFLEILTDGTGSLGVKRRTVARPYGKEGAYGTINTSSSIESIQTVTSDGKPETISVSDYKLITSQSLYYLLTNGKSKLILNKKTILNAYPKSTHSQIELFITEGNIDLRKEDDLIALIDFCNQL